MQAPRYSVYVMVDEPKPNARSHGFATAGWVAAPAANMVISRIAPILGMLPEPATPEIQRAIAMPMNGRGVPGAAPPPATPAANRPPTRQTTESPPRVAVTQREAALAPR
jgi:cell division protein FtsI (penicillin-binding protein 3)